MENTLKIIEAKINLNGRGEKSVWEYLTNDEREIYAGHLTGKKHFLSASKFIADMEKAAGFVRLHNEKFRV